MNSSSRRPARGSTAENLWVRILHESKIAAEETKIGQLDDGDSPQTYRGINIYRTFEVGHFEVDPSCASIHMIKQEEPMTSDLLDYWLARMKTYFDAEYGYRPDTP